MSAPIPDIEPEAINAGDTAAWLIDLADYPPSEGWALTYTLANAANRYTFNATASGSSFLVTVPAATTAAWVAGSYAWRAQVSYSGEVYTVRQGNITIAPSFGAAVDARSLARRQLDAIEAVLEGRASSAVAEYTIVGRAVKNIPLPELLALRDRLRFDVQREDAATRAAAGLPARGRILVRWSGQ